MTYRATSRAHRTLTALGEKPEMTDREYIRLLKGICSGGSDDAHTFLGTDMRTRGWVERKVFLTDKGREMLLKRGIK